MSQPSPEKMLSDGQILKRARIGGTSGLVDVIAPYPTPAELTRNPVFTANGTTQNVVAGKTVNVGNLLPAHRGYYMFTGSLTTPPCTENVRWFVLKTPIGASEAQVQEFRARYTHNNRPTQPLNARVIEETKSE